MRLIVTGSRDWTDPDPVHEALERNTRRDRIELVVADHRDGAEDIARKWALDQGLEHHTYCVHNNRRSRKTPELRDAAIVRDGADLCLAFTIDELPRIALDCAAAGVITLACVAGKWQQLS